MIAGHYMGELSLCVIQAFTPSRYAVGLGE